MSVVISDKTYYRMGNICEMVGTIRSNFFRWSKEGIASDAEYRDWRGWRLFTAAQLETIRTKTNHVTVMSRSC